MKTIVAKNVNEAIVKAMVMFERLRVELEGTDSCALGRRISPRGQETLEINGPVATTYLNPKERVLFDPDRDANPFFHLMESLWVLVGANDVEFLRFFNKRMEDFSDDGKVFHAPYGYRLRYTQSMFNMNRAVIDQLDTVTQMLQENGDTRRAVLQIWDAGLDLYARSKDVPCNDMVFTKIRDNKLNITVCNRSNDVIWGAYGVNVVQFSMLQEYLAGRIGVEVGIYTQVSDSFHIYTCNPTFEKLKDKRVPFDKYDELEPFPLMTHDSKQWDKQLKLFIPEVRRAIKENRILRPIDFVNQDPFFSDVALPVANAYISHKKGAKDAALMWAGFIVAQDWQYACVQWLTRRYNK